MLSVYYVFVLIVCFKHVFAEKKEICQPTDNICITNAVREHVYQKFVGGLPGVPSSDPLYLDPIDAEVQNFKYILKKPTLIGLKKCDFLKLKLNKEDSAVTYELLCPHLMIKSEYEVKGEIDAVAVAGKGNCEINYENYYITVNGQFEKVKREDGKLHFHIIEFRLKLDLQAGVKSEYQNIAIDGKENAEEYIKKLEEGTRDIVMNTFLEKFIHNLQLFQKVVPLEESHVRYV